jgi:serine/threonine protein kinase
MIKISMIERSPITLTFLHRGLYQVLTEKYEWQGQAAEELTSFLQPMLDYNTEKRATAKQCLEHPWLQDVQ